jgi:hypothetical protein
MSARPITTAVVEGNCELLDQSISDYRSSQGIRAYSKSESVERRARGDEPLEAAAQPMRPDMTFSVEAWPL